MNTDPPENQVKTVIPSDPCQPTETIITIPPTPGQPPTECSNSEQLSKKQPTIYDGLVAEGFS